MKITKGRLKRIIKEELRTVLREFNEEELEEMQAEGQPWLRSLPRTIPAGAQPSITATYVKMTFDDGAVVYELSEGGGAEDHAQNALSQGTLRTADYETHRVKPVEAVPVQLTFSMTEG